jgi:hypothetical protein
MSLLPLDAPILATEKLRVGGDYIETFDQAVARHTDRLHGSHPFKMAWGWRCDAAPESHEAVHFTGYKTAQAHATLATKKSCTDSDIEVAVIDIPCETMHVTHARNLEPKET